MRHLLPLILLILLFPLACDSRTDAGTDSGTDGLTVDTTLTRDGWPRHDSQPDLEPPTPDLPPARDLKPPPPDTLPPWPDLTPPDGGPMCTQTGIALVGTAGPKGKADILFVVDNSAGMDVLQQQLVNAVGTLESTLGATADYRIGVISTDLGAAPYQVSTCLGCGDDATLQSQPFFSSCLAPTSKILENNKGTVNFAGSLSNAFKCLASVGVGGCGFEQPLQSAAIFLTNPQSFVRSDASLILVLLTNEDDCSAKNPVLYDPNAITTLGPLTSFRCFQHGITCDINDPLKPGPRTGCVPVVGGLLQDVSYYAGLFKGLKPTGRVGLVAIAGPPSPVSVSVQGGNSSLNPSCQSAQGTGAPAIRIKALVDTFGTAGKLHSICAASYATAMQDVAALVQAL